MTRRELAISISVGALLAFGICAAVLRPAVQAQQPAQDPLGDAPLVVVIKTGQQYFLFSVTGGVATVTAIEVVDLIPNPDPPPQPPPSELSAVIVAEVEKIAENDARHAAALKLSATYEMLADQTIPVGKTASAVNTIANLALSSDAATWSGVTAVVNAALGKCATEAAADAVLKNVSGAIASTVPSAGDTAEAAARYGLDWEKFLAFLMDLLIKLLPLLIK